MQHVRPPASVRMRGCIHPSPASAAHETYEQVFLAMLLENRLFLYMGPEPHPYHLKDVPSVLTSVGHRMRTKLQGSALHRAPVCGQSTNSKGRLDSVGLLATADQAG